MKRGYVLTFLIAAALLGGCRQLAKVGGEVLEKRAAAEEAARLAERQLEKASRNKATRREIEEALEKYAEAARRERELRESAKALADSQEKREAEDAAEKIGARLAAVGDGARALELESSTEADVERLLKEEGKSAEEGESDELCRTDVNKLVKKAACMYVKAYARGEEPPGSDEVASAVGKSVMKSCLPKHEGKEWAEKLQTVQEIVKEVREEPDGIKKLGRAAASYGCDVR
jgi:hypothetical protein